MGSLPRLQHPRYSPPDALSRRWARSDGDVYAGVVSAPAGAHYILEEATRPNFSGAGRIYTGPQNHLMIYGRSQASTTTGYG